MAASQTSYIAAIATLPLHLRSHTTCVPVVPVIGIVRAVVLSPSPLPPTTGKRDRPLPTTEQTPPSPRPPVIDDALHQAIALVHSICCLRFWSSPSGYYLHAIMRGKLSHLRRQISLVNSAATRRVQHADKAAVTTTPNQQPRHHHRRFEPITSNPSHGRRR